MVVLILNWSDDNRVSIFTEFFKLCYKVTFTSPLFRCKTRLIAKAEKWFVSDIRLIYTSCGLQTCMKSIVNMSEIYRYRNGNSVEFQFNDLILVNGNTRCKCNLLGANSLYVSASLRCSKTRLYRSPKPCSFCFRCNFSHFSHWHRVCSEHLTLFEDLKDLRKFLNHTHLKNLI